MALLSQNQNHMKRRDILNMCSISSTGFTKLVSLGIIVKDDDTNIYSIPWDMGKMFKTSEVAGFLTRLGTQSNMRTWTIDQLLYVHREMFFDLHMGKCNKPLLRITGHDFRSLVESVDPLYVRLFDKYYDYSSH